MTRWLWTAAIAALVTGCGGASKEGDDGESVVDDAPSWTLVEMHVSGEPVPIVPGSPPTLALGEDGRVFGHAGVNRYGGRLTTRADGRVSWAGGIDSTKMAGPPELMAQEEVFLAALERTDEMILEKDRLVLQSGDGAVRLVFR